MPDGTGLSAMLRNLNAHLLRVVSAVRGRTGREPGADPFRGLYVSETEAVQFLAEEKPAAVTAEVQPLPISSTFARLGEMFSLSARELEIVLIALAPELDSRYERIFAYLQDDVSRKLPSTELIISLLNRSFETGCSSHERFGPSSPLVSRGIIRLSGDDVAPMARREVSLDRRIAAFLCGDENLDPRVARFCTLTRADGDSGKGSSAEPSLADPSLADPGLIRLARAATAGRSALVIHFRGENEEAKRNAAFALATELGAALLTSDIDRAARGSGNLEEWLRELSREAVLQRAIVLHRGLDRLPDDAVRETVQRSLSEGAGITIVSSDKPWQGDGARGVITLDFDVPEWPGRRRAWRCALQERGVRIRGSALDRLAECFRFTETQIQDAVETAAGIASYRGKVVREEHLFEAARSRSGHQLGSLTRKVQAVHGWDEIVVPEETAAQLREICRRVVFRHQVLGKWGFERKLSGGKGVNALFHGHSGTGKTMAAEVVARELQLDLYKIDLAGIVSKYIGETEKNLDRIFAAATTANAILFFDEADALFGKRSEVRDSHDRYANLEISYLLQKMEQYEGVAILATNLKQNLDDAFLRRLAFSVNFPFPDEASRQRIWAGIWPKETPLGADVDAKWLAARFLLSGGHIRNVALAAAFLASDDKGPVKMSHVLMAVRSEFQKMGKTFTAAELEPPAPVAVGATA
jgi:hypothetical protein